MLREPLEAGAFGAVSSAGVGVTWHGYLPWGLQRPQHQW